MEIAIGILVGAVLVLIAQAAIEGLSMRRRYDPDILGLQKYEADLLYQKEHGITLMPPPVIPGMLGEDWTTAELEAMRANRDAAEVLYRKIKEDR